MMSTRDFECKQIAFVYTEKGEKISFKNDNLIITDSEGKIKHQSTCYRLFLLFICGDACLTSGILERSKKFGFNIVFMSSNLRIKTILPAKAEGNVLLRKRQYALEKTDIAAHVIANKIHNQTFLLKKYWLAIALTVAVCGCARDFAVEVEEEKLLCQQQLLLQPSRLQ